MKTRTFVIEVTRVDEVTVTVPATYEDPTLLKDWERGLWEIPEGIKDIAKYAAEMALVAPNGSHDGIGMLLTSSWKEPDYERNPYQVKAVVREVDRETEILEEVVDAKV